LPDAAVKESKDRIRAAIRNSGYSFPRNHVTVNLAPRIFERKGPGSTFPSPWLSCLRKGSSPETAPGTTC
jgi:predicted ATPase with chaperone activity